jgi:hypothetical protein
MGQSLSETVTQINNLLKTHPFNIQTPQGVDVRSYDQIELNGQGKLTMLYYFKNPKTHVVGYTPISSFSYLKNLSIGDTKDLKNEEYAFLINCSSGENCITLPATEILSESKENTIKFHLDTMDARDKCKTAFSHLLDLAKSNKEFKK